MGIARREEGAVALILAAVLAGLIGTTALVFDLGRAWNLDTELQDAVDAAAIAGASQLDGAPGARARAVQAAVGALARNGQIFADASGPGVVGYDTGFPCAGNGCAMTNGNFRFLANLAPRADALSDTEARFVEVRATGTLRFAFARLLGAASGAAPRAGAVASWDRFACGRAVVLIANPDEPADNRDPRLGFDASRYRGAGITLRPGDGMAWLAVVTCDSVSQTCTAARDGAAVRDGAVRVLAPQACIAQATVARPIAAATMAEAVNMRMDIYPSGGGFAGDPDFQPSPNSLTGLVPATGAAPGTCSFDAGGGGGTLALPDNPFLGPDRHPPNGTAPLDHMGYPRDNCAYLRADGTAPPDNCIAVPPVGSDIAPGR